MATPEAEEAPQPGKSKGRRTRPQGAYWPIVAAALLGLFLAASALPLSIRVFCATIVLLLPWAAFRFIEALTGDHPRAPRTRAVAIEPQRRRADPALALPGLLGWAYFGLAFVHSAFDVGREDKTTVLIICWMFAPLLFFTAIVGLVAALDRAGPFRLLAIAANGTYIVLAATLLYVFLSPVS